MRFVLATTLLVALASPSVADDKKKDDDEAVRCLIVRAGDKDVSPPVEVDYTSKFRARTKLAMTPQVARTLCQSESNKPATEVIRDNGSCGGKKLTWKYTVTFGKPGKEERFEKTAICPKKR